MPYTELEEYSRHGNLEAVQKILAHASPEKLEQRLLTDNVRALPQAAFYGRNDIVAYLLEKAEDGGFKQKLLEKKGSQAIHIVFDNTPSITRKHYDCIIIICMHAYELSDKTLYQQFYSQLIDKPDIKERLEKEIAARETLVKSLPEALDNDAASILMRYARRPDFFTLPTTYQQAPENTSQCPCLIS